MCNQKDSESVSPIGREDGLLEEFERRQPLCSTGVGRRGSIATSSAILGDKGVFSQSRIFSSNMSSMIMSSGSCSEAAVFRPPSSTARSVLEKYSSSEISREFVEDSTLHVYLSQKVPRLISLDRRCYPVTYILYALKHAILNQRLYDIKNSSIVLCDEELGGILEAKALHISEIRERVSKHLQQHSHEESKEAATPNINVALSVTTSLTPGQNLLGGQTNSLPDCPNPTTNGRATSKDVVGVAASGPSVPFDLDAYYRPKPAFLEVIRQVPGTDREREIFSYRELTSLLSRYILDNKAKLFDQRNHMVVICKDDALGKAFNVSAFHRSQVTPMLRKQLTRVSKEEVERQNNMKRSSKDDDISESECLEPDSSTGPQPKRQRRRNRTISVTLTPISYSSSEEGKEEGDEEAVNKEDSEESSDGDDIYTVENVYSVEYELDSDSDDGKENDKGNESDSYSESSDMEDVLLTTAVAILDTDFGNLGDSSETEDLESSGNEFQGHDPEIGVQGDTWKCLQCQQPNTPYIRYCQRCWKERKGWVPDRPKPRRRKRKATDGQTVKGSKRDCSRSISETSEATIDSGLGSQNSLKSFSSDEGSEEKIVKEKDKKVADGFDTSNPAMICTLCCVRPKDASFIHGKYSHQVCCYRCAKKLYKQKKSCPVCRRKIEKITKHVLCN